MEERIQNLENQLKAALQELESIKKELAEEKARNTELTKENTSLKEQVREWQVKYEEEHKLVIKLTEENEKLKLRIVDLENQLKIEDEKPYDVADMKYYMELRNAIDTLTSKLETLDAREKKADEKLLNMIQDTRKDVADLEDTTKSLATEVLDLAEDVEELKDPQSNDTPTEALADNLQQSSPKPEPIKDEYQAFFDQLED